MTYTVVEDEIGHMLPVEGKCVASISFKAPPPLLTHFLFDHFQEAIMNNPYDPGSQEHKVMEQLLQNKEKREPNRVLTSWWAPLVIVLVLGAAAVLALRLLASVV